jgi:hypothetical protein
MLTAFMINSLYMEEVFKLTGRNCHLCSVSRLHNDAFDYSNRYEVCLNEIGWYFQFLIDRVFSFATLF